MRVKKLAYHRNGVTGAGFYVGIVKHECGNMLVVRFPKELDKKAGNVLCAAFNLDLLAEENITFGENSWRGDHFHEAMDRAILAYESGHKG